MALEPCNKREALRQDTEALRKISKSLRRFAKLAENKNQGETLNSHGEAPKCCRKMLKCSDKMHGSNAECLMGKSKSAELNSFNA